MKNSKYPLIKRGFTLIELLVVIAIIGILASTVLVSINATRTKASDTRVQAELVQLRTQFEQSFANNVYLDLEGSAGNTDTLVTTTNGYANLTTLLCDIAKLNGYPTTVPNDIELTCDGNPNTRTGVVIYSNETGTGVSSYGAYATTTSGGYICVDNFGNVNSVASGIIPDYASIVSTSTALCQ